MPPLSILISNDDGVFAEGIRTLANAAAARGHRVTVVCPDQERSATGHGLTLQTPLRAERADALFDEGVIAWACSGTPSDCVKLALGRLLTEPPDLVLSPASTTAPTWAVMSFIPARCRRRWRAPWRGSRRWR